MRVPLDARPDVVELELEAFEPRHLIGPLELALGRLRELEEPVRVAVSELVERAVGAQARDSVLSHGLEHREADVAIRDVTAHEAPRHQRLEVAEETGS